MGPRRRPTRPRPTNRWPALAVLGLVLATVSILMINQNHSGDPLKVRRELRKF